MSNELSARLRAVFLVELEEQAAVMGADLIALEREPSSRDHLKSLFRVVHTLKGAARAVGITSIERLCHALESMLVPARDGRIRLSPEHFAILYAATDILSDAAARMRDEKPVNDDAFAGVERRVAQLSGTQPRQAERTAAPIEGPTPEPAASPPPLRAAADEGVAPPLRIAPEKLDRLLTATDDLRMAMGGVQGAMGSLDVLEARTASMETAWRSIATRLREGRAADGDALAAVESFHELVRTVARKATSLAAATTKSHRQLVQISREISVGARRLRMRPFQEICEALPRAARDVATQRGREVELRIAGGDVEADRAVLDALREPLLHLVRNAVDHGIEDPGARVSAGKPRAGVVTVRAEIRSHQLLVSVSDDGAGIDTAAIRATVGPASPRDDRDLAALLFQSGFTTRREATAISGRGIGLDVVRAAVERIGGNVTLEWKSGGGTTFALQCPLTLAEIRAVLVSVGTHTFALPIASVVRMLRVPRNSLQRAEGRTVLSVAGVVVEVARLATILGPPYAEPPLAETIPAVLIESLGRQLVLVVDGLLDEREIIVRPVDGSEAGSLLTGATLLPDLGVAPVLNAAALIDASASTWWVDAPAEPGMPASVRSTVLVADDSITTRSLEQSMLEAAGYNVITAVDGREAWQLLQDRGADLVVSDVEMPGMDGFGLCRAIRSSPRFARLPVILVTALELEEHRAAGLAAGADAYIGKSTFDQRTLLDVVRQFLG